MSTRCQIGFYETEPKTLKDLSNFESLIYRHSDGYPGTEDGKEYGVLADIVPFLQFFENNRGIDDIEYCSARLLQYLCNLYDKHGYDSPFIKENDTKPLTGILGHGICKDFHGDIEYYYAVFPSGVAVYKTTTEKWQKIKTIPIVKS